MMGLSRYISFLSECLFVTSLLSALVSIGHFVNRSSTQMPSILLIVSSKLLKWARSLPPFHRYSKQPCNEEELRIDDMEKRRKLQCLGGSIDFMGVKNGSISQGAELQLSVFMWLSHFRPRSPLIFIAGRWSGQLPVIEFHLFFYEHSS